MSFADRAAFGRGRRGFGLAVIISAAATSLVSVLWVLPPDEFSAMAMLFLTAFMVTVLVIGFVAALILLPLTAILESNRLERPWTYPLAGFCVGAATMIAISDAVGVVRLDEQMVIWTASGALPGCLCGTLWWFFDRRHAQLERGIEQRSHNG